LAFPDRGFRDVGHAFGRAPIRLNLGPMGKRHAARTARLPAGHAESAFQALLKTASDADRYDGACRQHPADPRREQDVETATFNALAERLQDRAGRRKPGCRTSGRAAP